MARAKNTSGNGRLEEATTALTQSVASLNQSMAILVQNQAAFLARASETDRIMAETNRINTERFARIEATLAEHTRLFKEVFAILRALPEAVREMIGLEPVEKSPAGT